MERTVQSIRNPFGLILTPESTTPSDISSSTIVAQSPRYMDAHTQASPVHRDVGVSPMRYTQVSCEGGELIDTNTAETRAVQYVDGPDRTVFVKTGGRDCVAFLFTEKTVRLLSTMIEQRKKLESTSNTFQEANRAAKFGAHFLEYSEDMLAKATSKEEYDQIKEDMNRRQPGIQKDIERKESLDRERQDCKYQLDYSRSKAEDIFEQILLDAQLMQDRQDDVVDFSAASNTVLADSEMEREESTASGARLTGPDPLEEFHAARRRLLEAQMDFDSMKWVQEQKTIEFCRLEQEGLAQFSESELDLYHVQMGRDVTRALIDAEQNYSEACVKAQGLGLLENGYDQESGLEGGSTDGCSAFIDPGVVAASFNPSSIQAWADKVSDSEEQETIAPETDDWDYKSVTMSDSVSVVATDHDRKWIDRWRSVCEGGGGTQTQ